MMKPIYEGALLDGWMELPLRDAIFLKRGYSWSKDQEASDPQPGTTPVIRIPNIQSRLDLSDLLQRTAHRISAGSVCRHLKIAGRIAFFIISLGYQSPPATVVLPPSTVATTPLSRSNQTA